MKFKNSILGIATLICLTACSSSTEQSTFVPPTESEFLSYYNKGPGCTGDSCFSIVALSASPKDKPWIWCAQIETKIGKPYYENDGLLAGVNWEKPTMSQNCFRVATDENGRILYTESMN